MSQFHPNAMPYIETTHFMKVFSHNYVIAFFLFRSFKFALKTPNSMAQWELLIGHLGIFWIFLEFLTLANKICEGYFFTDVCLSTGEGEGVCLWLGGVYSGGGGVCQLPDRHPPRTIGLPNPWADSPRQTPPWADTLGPEVCQTPWADTPPGQTPPGRHPPDIPLADTMGYGQQVGCMHPTGICHIST